MTAIKELKAVARARAGKGAARAERRAGRVPAVIYGEKQEPVTISLNFVEINKAIYAGHFLTTLFEIDVDGAKHRVIPRDYQMDVVKDFPMHVDFLRVSKGTTLTVEVPVHFVNQDASPALKAGGTLNVVTHAVELDAPADSIPEAVVVDLTGANFGDIFHLSTVQLPAGVTWAGHGDDTLATVMAPTVAPEAAVAAAAEETKA
ncbi:50S ribosomal protein L25/general stress protein Ctc [Xanthobacter agilis]|jgi:large subunit ribosomal protein L25|uniref:Large ribosomal subunit protein bL25 n=1 Tax=Xanthobacter agilis TaxID=47492 RepID=A0ABU0LFG2_XANAG|nr:50S ribosomal protein L25/general stress protein Ctc [Xanthobacter agilis]MDQ0505879.1 large subunit ribosomal protein L25 [Xanthobacter agilis]